jgi:hypothetical protein
MALQVQRLNQQIAETFMLAILYSLSYKIITTD